MPVLQDIKDQLRVLPEVYKWTNESGGNFADLLKSHDEIFFIGCGSSYYISLTASRYTSGILKKLSFSLPAGEVILAKEWSVPKLSNPLVVMISRSGETTEVLRAVEIFNGLGVKTAGITLEENSSLVKTVDFPIVLPYTEESVVMTKSFTGMLLFLQLTTEMASNLDKEMAYETLFKSLEDEFERFSKEAEEFSDGSHYVFLGTGPYEGIARESALKLQEMSLTTTEAYSTLEYRHGPKSLVEEGVRVVIFGDGEEEKKLANEINQMRGKAILRRKMTNFYEDSFIQVIFSQLLGYNLARRKGVDIENPRNLTKVVKLDDGR